MQFQNLKTRLISKSKENLGPKFSKYPSLAQIYCIITIQDQKLYKKCFSLQFQNLKTRLISKSKENLGPKFFKYPSPAQIYCIIKFQDPKLYKTSLAHVYFRITIQDHSRSKFVTKSQFINFQGINTRPYLIFGPNFTNV